MKIAIPVVDGRLSMHFGHCDEFAVVETDDESAAIGAVRYVDAPAHEPGLLPRWLSEMDVTVVIAGGMGRRAQEIFAQEGIRVVVGAPAESPEAVARSFVEGTLQAGENVCDH